MSGARPLPLDRARGPSRGQALAVGRALHVARVAGGIDLATVARDLLIPRRDLEALEEGDFGRVAGRVRLAVLLRAYGNYLGLDGDRLTGPWKAEVDRLDPPPAPERPAPGGGRRRGVALAAAALLLAGAAGYGALRRPAPATPASAGPANPAPDGRPAVLPAALPGPAATATGEGADIEAPVSPSRPGAAEAPAEERRAGEVGSGPAPAMPVPDGGPTTPPEGAGIVLAAAGVPEPVGLPAAPPDGRGGGPPGTGDADPAPVPEPSPAPATSPTGATGKPVADGPHAGPVPAAMVGPPLAPADDEEGAARVGDAAPAGVPPRVGVPPASPPPAGGWAVQVAAVRDPAEVPGEWRRVAARHPGVAGLAPREPQAVEVPGRGRFWRVLAGSFATRAEAEAACARVRAGSGACRALAP